MTSLSLVQAAYFRMSKFFVRRARTVLAARSSPARVRIIAAAAAVVLLVGAGILGITSYTIRISATQSYVPDEKKGRFNGAFSMLSTVGALIGEFSAGILSERIPERVVLLLAMLLCALAAVVFIGGSRSSVAAIYNRTE